MKFIASLLFLCFTSSWAFTVLPSSSSSSRITTSLADRTPFISGNWKLNPQTRDEAVQLATDIADSISDSTPSGDVALFVPYVFIEAAQAAVKGRVQIGAEGVCPEIKGAFTGAVSASMLQSIGVNWALAGHSERRVLFGETDEYINGQCRKLMELDMNVMLCIGESLQEYEQDLASAVCALQLKKGLAGIDAKDMERVAIAYEPVWAIGTGKVATPDVAQKVHQTCRSILSEMYGETVASQTRILYGGSVTPDSIDSLMAQPDIDGVLVGGASLDASKFGRIINYEN